MQVGKIVVNALALVVASLVVPHFRLSVGPDIRLLYLLLLAIAFGVINTYIRPLAKLASLPLSLFMLGAIGFVVNALMLLLLVFVAGLFQHDPYVIRLGSFPPSINSDALIAAIVGAFVISIVSTVLAWLVPDR